MILGSDFGRGGSSKGQFRVTWWHVEGMHKRDYLPVGNCSSLLFCVQYTHTTVYHPNGAFWMLCMSILYTEPEGIGDASRKLIETFLENLRLHYLNVRCYRTVNKRRLYLVLLGGISQVRKRLLRCKVCSGVIGKTAVYSR